MTKADERTYVLVEVKTEKHINMHRCYVAINTVEKNKGEETERSKGVRKVVSIFNFNYSHEGEI